MLRVFHVKNIDVLFAFICSIFRLMFVVDPQGSYKFREFYIRCILVCYCVLISHQDFGQLMFFGPMLFKPNFLYYLS